MLGHLALDKEHGLIKVYAHGQQKGIGLLGVSAQLRRHLADGEGVQVGQGVDALIPLVLKLNVIAQSSQIVAQSKSTRTLIHA